MWCAISRAPARPAATSSGCGGDFYAFGGELALDPTAGALLPGAGDGVTQLFYVQWNGSTFLIADENDNGVLNAGDFAVEFTGLHDFTLDDFNNTDFVIAGTNGDDVILGTEDGDRIFAARGNDIVTALGGDDEVHGGAGDDLLDGGPGGFDNLYGEGGNDTLTLAGSDIGGNASGGAGNDMLFGSDASFSSFDNNLQGEPGATNCTPARSARRWTAAPAPTACSTAPPTTR